MMNQLVQDTLDLLNVKTVKPIIPVCVKVCNKIYRQASNFIPFGRNILTSKTKCSQKMSTIHQQSSTKFKKNEFKDKNLSSEGKESFQELDSDSKELLRLCRKMYMNKRADDPLGFAIDCNYIYQLTTPLLSRHKLDTFYNFLFKIIKIMTLSYFLWISWKYVPIVRKVTISGMRRAEINLLPFWDWKGLYYKSCVIYNPFYQPDTLKEDDCQACLGIKLIPKLSNVTREEITERYLKADVPFIVTDGSGDWSIMDWPKLGSVKFKLKEFYESSRDLDESYPCLLTTNLRRKNVGSKTLRRRILTSGPAEKFYAYWENCEKRAGKLFRRLYLRPYFLPPMVEMTISNWIFLSQSYAGVTLKNIPIDSTSVWMAQVAGVNEIRLIPKKPCHNSCQVLSDTLYPGEIIVWNDFLWSAYYIPSPNLTNYYKADETLAIASGLVWNR